MNATTFEAKKFKIKILYTHMYVMYVTHLCIYVCICTPSTSVLGVPGTFYFCLLLLLYLYRLRLQQYRLLWLGSFSEALKKLTYIYLRLFSPFCQLY